jgi:flavin reductase ActVB
MSVDPESFKAALSQFPSGVTVVTAAAGGEVRGLTVSAFCSVSLAPPLVLVCVDVRSEANETIEAAQAFGISMLGEGQEEVSRHCATGGRDKFRGFTLEPGPFGVPLVPGATARLECRVHARHVEGDHVVWIGDVQSASASGGPPLVHHDRRYRRLAPLPPSLGGAAGRDRL